MPSPPVITQDIIIADFTGSLRTKYVGVASFTLMVWDHILTFNDEVEYIWFGNKGPLVYLFFINRYLIPLSFIVNIYAYFYDGWTYDTDPMIVDRAAIAIVGAMMFLRVQALYHRSLLIQGFVLSILVAFVAINGWLLASAEPVYHAAYPLVDSCTMIFNPHVGPIAASSAWLPLLYDTVVVALTLYRTVRAVWSKTAGQIFRVLLREGLLYYSVIFSVTLVLTIMIVAAPPGIKNITAQLELCLTVTMMSRITLHLKHFAHKDVLSASTNVGSPQRHVSWHSLVRPARARTNRQGHVQRIQRPVEDSFFAMAPMGGEIDVETQGRMGSEDSEVCDPGSTQVQSFRAEDRKSEPAEV
ncbi:hypothetical protein BV25DRAFT_1917716 [Artomyces pyxidatus]|uniref:Uncharacterized protein n=1 Tax=Artomyces pyxidatus TaxID=48021 RepID=A0ACB8SUS0_9AGAM|nr:hypothetical protein BV25DRAFT_1917716 [Artomyces pyxidatus]